MTSAPQPQATPSPARAAARAGTTAAATGTTSATAVSGLRGAGPRVAPGTPAPPATARTARPRARLDVSSTPARLRFVRGLAAAACLVPGIAGMVEVATAANAPVTSPAETYANLRAAEARYQAEAYAATSLPGRSLDATTAAATTLNHQLGAAALLDPDRSASLYDLGDQVTKRQQTVIQAWAGLQSKPTATQTTGALGAPDASYTKALTTLPTSAASAAATNAYHLVVAGAVGLVGLVGASIWMAGKTRRVVNPGLLGAALVTAGVAAWGASILGATGPSPTVQRVATVRTSAAQVVAAESASVGANVPDATQSTDAVKAAEEAIRGLPTAERNKVQNAWNVFTESRLGTAQLSQPLSQRVKAVDQRLSSLDTLNTTLAAVGRAAGEGSNTRPNAALGYGLFTLSLLAASLGWAGVGRRVSEYR